MRKFKVFLDNFERIAITLILPIMVIVVFLATFFRYTRLANFPWMEELARYLMIWLVFLGIGVGAKNNSHFTVDNLVNALPKSLHVPAFILRTLIIIGFCGYMLYNSINLISRIAAMGQLSPALRIPIWIAYSAIPVGLTLMIVRTIQFAVLKYKKNSR